VLITHQEPGPRVRVSLMPAQAATIEDVGGGMLKLTCGENAAQMLVERVPVVHGQEGAAEAAPTSILVSRSSPRLRRGGRRRGQECCGQGAEGNAAGRWRGNV
jgi:hypothetical protein